ncbi:PREDICTED: limb region 1 protein homolog isoform X6 [Cercocebus atys]|uniref:limb region 1 protein homolog isoform X6 n=1 Tax=Cercocebus atys TaxID=9531 RepID=UPI0005F4849F|nr:PREDICTED: limb region 1 protein homolog isoform X6 [Cercocebus atys]
MEGQDEVSAREQHFHSQVRESTICFLLFAILYVVSYFIITRYKRKSDEQEDEDAIVNRISFVESCFPFFQPLFICIDAFCLFLSGIRRLCWPEKDLWEFYLPYLYSCISLMGCLLLLLCTPVGLSRMFTVMGQLLVKPTILEDLDEQIYIITLEEEALQRRLNGLSSSVECNIMELEQELENVKTLKTKLERRKKASAWERNLVYPAVMVLLLIETSISVLLVACNILCLLVDETAMPKGTRGPGIGNASLSTFGFVGAALEIILIFYLMVSSVVGFYSLRFFGNFTPKKDDTTMTKIIGNCVSILVLSSALPVMSRTLGITRFDLLGDFGRFNWLGNFYIVLSYNLLFAIVTTLCLVRKFTSAVREELFKALGLHKLHLSNTSRDSETAKPSVNGHQKAL